MSNIKQGMHQAGTEYGAIKSSESYVWSAASQGLQEAIENSDEDKIAWYQGLLTWKPTDAPSDDNGFLFSY